MNKQEDGELLGKVRSVMNRERLDYDPHVDAKTLLARKVAEELGTGHNEARKLCELAGWPAAAEETSGSLMTSIQSE